MNSTAFHSLVTASSEALYIMSPDWKEMTVLNSKGFLSETVTPDKDWMQKYIHPDDRSYVTEKINEAISSKKTFELEHRVIMSDRSLGWTHSRAIPVINNEGEITEWVGAASDITNRKKAEEALLESEEKFSAAFKSNPNGIVLSRKKDGYIMDVNDSFLTLFERTREEVIGQSSITLFMFANPDDRQIVIDRLTKEGRLKDYEIMIRRKSGELRVALLSSVPVHIAGNEAMVTTLQDITERKRLEQESILKATEIEAIMSGSADGILVFDNNGRIIRYNTTASDLLCLTGDENLTLEKRIIKGFRLVTEDGNELNLKETPAFRAFGNGERVQNQVLLLLGCGDSKWLNISSAPLIISGRHSGAVVSLSDITRLKLNEEALLNNEKHLRELNATKDKLFSIISHDLRNPFTSIIGFTELLIDKAEKNDTEEILRFSRIIRESSLNIMNLLTNLIEWSKMQSGRLDVKREEFDLVRTVQEVFDLMQPLALQKSIDVKDGLPDNLFVIADRSMISTIIRNLVSNAIKFTPRGGQVSISGYEKNNSVLIEVEDSGTGIERGLIEKLFSNDSNYSNRGTENETGTGLGLIICQELVSKHEGSIRVESETGKGSRFVVTIPQIRESE